MRIDTEEILKKVRALSDQEKIELVEAILKEIESPDPEIDRIWTEEALKRWQAYKEGKVDITSYDKLMAKYRTE